MCYVFKMGQIKYKIFLFHAEYSGFSLFGGMAVHVFFFYRNPWLDNDQPGTLDVEWPSMH